MLSKKAFFVVIALVCVLSSCSNPFSRENNTSSSESSNKNSEDGQSKEVTDRAIQEWDIVSVNYIGKYENGSVFDTSLESVAKEAKLYNPERKYEPLSFGVNEQGGVISGMWKGVVGMRKGEKKTLTIAPKDAYGEEWVTSSRILSKNAFDPTITQSVPRSEAEDTVRTTIDKSYLVNEDISIGKVITANDGTKATIEAITGTGVTIAIDNSKNIFHGKKLAVGTEVNAGKTTAKITALTKDTITLAIKNDNPFAWKKLSVGLSAEYQGQKLRIEKIDGENITLQVSRKNEHNLAGKTLIFDVEIVSIHKAP